MEKQEPVGTLHDDGYFVWRKTAPYKSNYAGWKMALYALPGAQNGTSVPDGLTPLEAIQYWADAYANPKGDAHFIGHGVAERLLREYADLRAMLAAPEAKP